MSIRTLVRRATFLISIAAAVVLPADAARSAEPPVPERIPFLERLQARAQELQRERTRLQREQMEKRWGRHLALPPESEDDAATGSAKGHPGGFARARDTDWTPYAGPFGLGEASHLLRRTMVGPRIGEMRDAAAAGLNVSVANLLMPRPLPAPPDAWALEPVPDLSGWTQPMIDSLVTLYFTRDELLKLWWAKAMIGPNPGITEEMTLFLHDHFATSYAKVLYPQSMYKQNQLLRQYAVGNFKTLVHQIAADPAMLIWLDGNDNWVNHLNENFARELLELFTMGLDQYSQDDVVAAARAFTGTFTFDGITSVYIPGYHDHGMKTFLGQTGNWDGDDIIEIIFQQDETARFICRKLYRWYVDENPDEALIENLAQTLRASNYELGPVLSRMFKSSRFYDTNFRGSIYCDGIDRNVGLLRSFYLDTVDFSDPGGPQTQWTWTAMILHRQTLFAPPNVGGWLGYRAWLNSYVLPWRRQLDVSLVDGNLWGWDLQMKLDGVGLVQHTSDPNDPATIVNEVTACYYGFPPTPAVRQRLLDELLQGMDPDQWRIDYPFAERHIEAFMRLLIRMPDFQLK